MKHRTVFRFCLKRSGMASVLCVMRKGICSDLQRLRSEHKKRLFSCSMPEKTTKYLWEISGEEKRDSTLVPFL